MIRRWFARSFLTRREIHLTGRPEYFYVERPDWWRLGATSGVTDTSFALAEARLDEWQDELYAKRKTP